MFREIGLTSKSELDAAQIVDQESPSQITVSHETRVGKVRVAIRHNQQNSLSLRDWHTDPSVASVLGILHRTQARWRACQASAIIKSLAFSPIMIAGALVLPLTISGMIEQSATRRFSSP
ncbi:hypothetical protein SAMN06265380_10923 [Ruegeria faecimaris]|uniref:Uncharacterized protein n=1 Tax=Ruegeria faecimaris TaxID=686389 RepID=A0A521E458_9RHOB|nr:hypothetical protein SAMN06265380_10923 [Ruegeria faecimaris]